MDIPEDNIVIENNPDDPAISNQNISINAESIQDIRESHELNNACIRTYDNDKNNDGQQEDSVPGK